jgi:hypothetical protein
MKSIKNEKINSVRIEIEGTFIKHYLIWYGCKKIGDYKKATFLG